MNPADWIVVAVVVAILGLAGWYVYKAKKNGAKCIGCSGGCGSCTSCGCHHSGE